MNARMRAAVSKQYGGARHVEVREVDRPTATGDQVLVRVRAASVNRADLDYLEPRPKFLRLFIGIRGRRNPRIGFDVAGVVEAVGPSATCFRPGDRVYADLFPFGGGSFAEYVVAPERAFRAIPESMSFEVASTLPHSAVLAVLGLRRRNGTPVQRGDRVLIDGASGNVGPFAVQIAKARGAEVTGVSSASKADMVRELGADHVIDYRSTDYTKTGERYDLILDVDSHHGVLDARRALRPKGAYLVLGGSGWAILNAMVVGGLLSLVTDRWSGLVIWWRPFDPAAVDAVETLIAAGSVTPLIDRTYPLADVKAALERLERGEARGKLVILC
jgi:NADPH:quinone reductase-like Zn-dependent oxidoreductase